MQQHPSTVDWLVVIGLVCVPLLAALVAAEVHARRARRGRLSRPASTIDLRRFRW